MESRPAWQRFKTQQLPKNDRLPVFSEELSKKVALDVVSNGAIPFAGTIDRFQAGAVGVARIKASPCSFTRTPKLLGDGRDTLFAVLCVEGLMHSTQTKAPKQIGPGEGFLCDSTMLGGMVLETNAKYWSLAMPRSDLAKLTTGFDGTAGRSLKNTGAVLHLLASYLNGLDKVVETGDGLVSRLFGKHVLDLVAAAIEADSDVSPLLEKHGVKAARLQRLMSEIDNNLSDPNLSAVSCASRLDLSIRYVHHLLEETGRSFTEHVLQKRLMKAVQLLQKPENNHLKIADIAYSTGFTDLSYFNRSFKQKYGDTPSSVRTGRGAREYL